MENILQLQASREACLRKINNIKWREHLLTKDKSTVELQKSEYKIELEKLTKEYEDWQKRLEKIDHIIYTLVEKTF